MPAISVLIKPASSACNMNCSYCFYKDVAKNRKNGFEGMLSIENAEKIVKSAMEFAQGSCSFMFQGGEPTLAGLDFFREFVRLEKKYAKKGVRVFNALQTNGYDLDEEWADFFVKNGFLIGLSLDGPAPLHDFYRTDNSGEETFKRVIRTAEIFKRKGVEFNILSVVTAQGARSIEKTYNFFKKQGFKWLQFIPCLEPLGESRENESQCMSVKAYADYLIRIFDLWFDDLQKGNYISIRHIDNWLSVLLTGRAENCGMNGRCSIQFVVEGDGGVYPCDFYVLDEYRMGTVGEQSFAELANSTAARSFVEASFGVPDECGKCEFYPLCRNGCRRDRETPASKNYYCSAYKEFFEKRGARLKQAAWIVHSM